MAIDYLYLSPHLDDAIYSCGATICEQTRAGSRVVVATMCAGAPPDGELSPFAQELQNRWDPNAASMTVALARRRREDEVALARVGAEGWYADVPDCIFRRAPTGEWLYPTRDHLFGVWDAREESMMLLILNQLRAILSDSPNAVLVAPLALGNHVDHQACHWLARRWQQAFPRQSIWFYEDYPYASWESTRLQRALLPDHLRPCPVIPLGEESIAAKVAAVSSYASQISSFWGSEAEMERDVRAFRERFWRE